MAQPPGERRVPPSRPRRASPRRGYSLFVTMMKFLLPTAAAGLIVGVRLVDAVAPDDRVIVTGLQQVRPGLSVEPNLVPMPTSKIGKVNTTADRAKVAAKP